MPAVVPFDGTLVDAINELTHGASWYTQDDMVTKNLNRPVKHLLDRTGIELENMLNPVRVTKVARETARKRGGEFKVAW